MWSRVAAWGGLLFAAVAVAGLGGEGIVSFLTKDAGQDVARAGMAFAFFLYSLAGLFAAAFVLSASLVILQKGIFWSWLGRYGLVVAAVNLIGAAAIFDTPDGPLGCSAPASLRPPRPNSRATFRPKPPVTNGFARWFGWRDDRY